jgi:hypothetical protein
VKQFSNDQGHIVLFTKARDDGLKTETCRIIAYK